VTNPSSSLATATAGDEVAVRLPYQLQTGVAKPEETSKFGPTSLRLTDIYRHRPQDKWTLADRDRPGLHGGGDPDLPEHTDLPLHGHPADRAFGAPRGAVRQGS
jgi:hypothetical protein